MDVEGRLTTQSSSSNFVKTCFNASGAFLGVGVLTIPYGLARGGWLCIGVLCLIAVVALYTTLLLKRCMVQGQDSKPITSYGGIAARAFGRKGQIAVAILANLELYVIAVGLLIIEGDNLHKLFPDFVLKMGQLTIGGKAIFVTITAFIILPSVLLSDIGIVSYITAVGLFSTLAVVVSVFCVGATADGVGFHGNGKLVSVEGLPTSVSLFMACFGGNPVIPTLYMEMRHKRNFTKAMVVGFSVNALVYLSIAVPSYLMYGSEAESQITLNLPKRYFVSKVAIYAALLIPITKYALMITPVANGLQSAVPILHKNREKTRVLLLTKVILLLSTTAVACVFPHFESLMAVVGSTFIVLGSFIFPCGCYIKISGAYKNKNWEFWGIVGIIILSILARGFGTYASIAGLTHDL